MLKHENNIHYFEEKVAHSLSFLFSAVTRLTLFDTPHPHRLFWQTYFDRGAPRQQTVLIATMRALQQTH